MGLFYIFAGQRISTANMGERGPVLTERFLPACEMTDILGPLGLEAPAGVRWPVRQTAALPPVVAAQGLHGSITIGVIVDASGKVTRACVRQPSGNPDLDSAIWADALVWRFTPGEADGRAAPFRMDVPVTIPPPPQSLSTPSNTAP